MKLTYRGVNYDYTPNPAPAMGSTFSTGHYRGAAVEFHTLAEVPEQPIADLTWRGVPYRTGTPAPAIADIKTLVPAEAPLAEVRRVEEATVIEPDVEPDTVARAMPTVATAATEAIANTTDKVTDMARNLFLRHHQRIRRREQVMMLRLGAEVGLPVDEAAHYESHIQGKVPHDFSGYDRSSVAMS